MTKNYSPTSKLFCVLPSAQTLVNIIFIVIIMMIIILTIVTMMMLMMIPVLAGFLLVTVSFLHSSQQDRLTYYR